MSKYTLQIRGEPLGDAVTALGQVDGVKTPSAEGWAVTPEEILNVTVDAPSLEEAKTKVSGALPAHGSYTVARPEPLEDDEDEDRGFF